MADAAPSCAAAGAVFARIATVSGAAARARYIEASGADRRTGAWNFGWLQRVGPAGATANGTRSVAGGDTAGSCGAVISARTVGSVAGDQLGVAAV